MIVLIICACILAMVGLTYLLARSGHWSPGNEIPPRQLPTELQRQELDRLAFQHRVRTRAILDSALHDIQKTARKRRNGR